MPRPFFTPGKEPVPIVQEAGWAQGPVWTVPENLATIGFGSPDPSVAIPTELPGPRNIIRFFTEICRESSKFG